MPMNQKKSTIIVPENPGPDTIRASALKVFDGDGFLTRIKNSEITGDQRNQAEFEATVRFGFIDAPELEQPGGHQAKEFLTPLIGGKCVELIVLTKMDTGRSVDRYRRIVCVPFLTEKYSTGEFRTPANNLYTVKTFGEPLFITRNIELEMVINGWAWVLERYEPDQRYFEALEDARFHQRGMWARKENIHPWEFKKQKHRATQAGLVVELSARDQCPLIENRSD
jgi:micrococcal nuclease